MCGCPLSNSTLLLFFSFVSCMKMIIQFLILICCCTSPLRIPLLLSEWSQWISYVWSKTKSGNEFFGTSRIVLRSSGGEVESSNVIICESLSVLLVCAFHYQSTSSSSPVCNHQQEKMRNFFSFQFCPAQSCSQFHRIIPLCPSFFLSSVWKKWVYISYIY